MHLKPKKSLGQNFLVDKNIQRKIINACAFKPTDVALEIGAGAGELTALIAERVNKVYAVEIDQRLYPVLKDRFKGCRKVEIINADILKTDLKKYAAQKLGRIKVIGNIPYYITTPIIGHLFKFRDKIKNIFLTVQKEFALRIAAGPGSKDYGSFSCFVQYYTKAKILFVIKRTCFYPQPRVDSCFLSLEVKEKPDITVKDEALFFKIVRQAFNQRRKTLRNSLRGLVPTAKLEMFFSNSNIDSNIRPEDLSLKEFAYLSNIR
jgi:16S rRNA (adenine1518-N6/adenine1519-N6)-dimethyltransferase